MQSQWQYEFRKVLYWISQHLFLIPIVPAIVLLAHLLHFGSTRQPLVFLNVYESNQLQEYPSLIVNLLGWLVTLAGILFSVNGVQRTLLFNALSKMLDDEWTPEQSDAKQLVHKAKPRESSDNPYRYVRQYVKGLGLQERIRLDAARRRLTGFWYRVALFHELRFFHDPNQIFTFLGDPDIIETLERLEAIKAESIEPDWKSRDWPPMKLLNMWYQEKCPDKAKGLMPQVPTQPALYEESKKSTNKDISNTNSKAECL